MNSLPGYNKGNTIADIHIRLLLDIIAVTVVADKDKQAVGILGLDFPDKFNQFPLSIPVVPQLPQEFFILLISRRQCRPHLFLVKAFGLHVHIIRRVVGSVKDDIEAGRIRQPFHDIGIKAFILTAPDAARHITEIAAAVEMLEPLCLCKSANAFPCSRTGIEKVGFIAEPCHLRCAGCGVRCRKGFRHGR